MVFCEQCDVGHNWYYYNSINIGAIFNLTVTVIFNKIGCFVMLFAACVDSAFIVFVLGGLRISVCENTCCSIYICCFQFLIVRPRGPY